MANLAACFWFGSLIVGIHGYQVDFKVGDDVWEPALLNSPDDYSTEQKSATSKNILFREESLSSTSPEHPVTLEPHPSLRPLEFNDYPPVRNAFILMAKNDYHSKMVFDFFNRPSELRAFIDSVFYSHEQYRKEVTDHSSALDKTSPDNEHTHIVGQLSEPEQNPEDNEIHGAGAEIPSVTSETVTRDPLEQVGLHFHKKLEALQRSGVLVKVKDFVTQIVHSTEETSTEVPIEDENSTEEKSEHDGNPSVATYDAPSEVPADSVYPEFSLESNHFTKDSSPVNTKIVFNTNIDELATKQIPYDSDKKFYKSKSVLTKEQAAHIASQAVEGALGLAETIARETSQLVNRIIMGALKHNVDKPQTEHGHFRPRIPKVKLHVVEKKPYSQ